VYRDLGGAVRAVEDRCPHRRLPLSMGRLTEDGSIQCPYHGWSFDGVTGRCTAIPNLRADERIPNGIKVAAFSAAENVAEMMGYGLRTSQLAPPVGPPTGEEPDAGTTMYDARLIGGLVFVWTGTDPSTASPGGSTITPSAASAVSDTVEVRSPYAAVAEAILLNPGAALGLGAVIGAGEELCAPAVHTDRHAVSVQRERCAYKLPRPSTFDPLSRRVVKSTITTDVTTGFTRVDVAAGRRNPACEVTIGLTPVGTYRTVVRWRAVLLGPAHRFWFWRTSGLVAARRWSGRATDTAEALSDAASRGHDPGVRALRSARLVADAHPDSSEIPGSHR
ncbi:Rieske 2Fe-2S domain-containing protein, partial [Mycobacterium sp.]|uniref:Rieske 2Fe-2S domain-containing protein n=1 Tax=Mycobacterium sp. TaxID=1785 RepID=UPI003C7132E8